MAATAYARAYHNQSILTASPGQLVLMLYDGCLRFMAQARFGFAEGVDNPRNLERINTSLQKASAILAELQANLDFEAGGDHAANLERLYDYYQRRLFTANLQKIEEPVIEVEALVRHLRDGWAEMLQQTSAGACA